METTAFFTNEHNRAILSKAISKLNDIEGKDKGIDISDSSSQALAKFNSSRNIGISQILKAALQEAAIWDQNCRTNITWIGGQLMVALDKINPTSSKEDLNLIFSICYRFLLEHFISMPSDFNFEYKKIQQFALEEIEQFDVEAQVQIRFAAYFMPIEIFKRTFNDENVVQVKTFNKLYDTSEKKLNAWEEEIEKSESRVNELKKILENHETAFNFVGLYDGFKTMSITKERERDNLLKWVRIAGLAILFPIALDFFLVFYNVHKMEDLQRVALISFIPMVSVIAILIYYFRILLHSLNEVKAQLLQIELRKTLCQFIQSYVKYSQEMKKMDIESLSKFENIIFSGLVSSNEKLPSTFDGLEQLANIIQAIRKPT
jgi:hypothetical protein